MGKRERYDWELIEREFRAGQISIREIASQHGCSDTAIRKKMKMLGVERDLSKKVAEKVRSDLVRSSVRTANPATEREIIETAASVAVEVVRSHRVKIKRGMKIVGVLFKKLEEGLKQNPDQSSLKEHAAITLTLSSALKNFIPLDRQAFNIDGNSGENDRVQEIKIVGVSSNDS